MFYLAVESAAVGIEFVAVAAAEIEAAAKTEADIWSRRLATCGQPQAKVAQAAETDFAAAAFVSAADAWASADDRDAARFGVDQERFQVETASCRRMDRSGLQS